MLVFGWSLIAASLADTHLDSPTVPATGRQETLLTVDTYGRYAVAARSSQGSAIQLIDRMAGPGDVHGTPGHTDGRVDAFLDRGTYKVIVRSDRDGSGEAALTADAFTELHPYPAPALPELRLLTTELADIEQRSWWIEVAGERTIAVEAAGRSLADLRLWRDGSWLVDLDPDCAIATPEEGRPLRHCQLTGKLPQGMYRLTAYGGPEQPWSDGSGHPLYVRAGVPALPAVGRQHLEISPFGVDRYRVPGAATYFRLELPESKRASLTVRSFDSSRPLRRGGRSDHIQPDSRVPVAEVSLSSSSGTRLVTISAAPGQPVVLQQFDPIEARTPISNADAHFVRTLHAGHAADNIDATAVLVRHVDVDRDRVRHEVADKQVVAVGPRDVWRRRFNLEARATLLVEILEGGDYELSAREGELRARLQPLLVGGDPKLSDFVTIDSDREAEWELPAGLYTLTLDPLKPGVVDLLLEPDSLMDSLKSALGMGPGDQKTAVRASAQFENITLKRGHRHTLYIGEQPGVTVGLVMRDLPLTLSAPLPLSLRPGEPVTLPVDVPGKGHLQLITPTGEPQAVSVNGSIARLSHPVRKGLVDVTVAAPTDETVNASLRFVPWSSRKDAPLPVVSEAALAGLPEFPVLDDRGPQPLDLARSDDSTWLVRVGEPGLYRLQSTGLLATEGNLRTRIRPSYVRQQENGVGRNFLIAEYLREGDYQLTVSTRGRSAGHLALALDRTRLVEGGALTDGVPARAALAAGEGVVYTFEIPEDGRYRLRAIGLSRSFRCRLEDADGWPLERPGGEADFTRDFAAGSYRLVLLPEDVESRRLTLLERVTEAQRWSGHGPHPLVLGRTHRHTWREPAEGEARTPDVWTVDLPASVTARLRLTGDMQGEIIRLDDAGEPAERHRTATGEDWTGALERGRYEIVLRNARHSDWVEYTLALTTEELVAGSSRRVRPPARVPISIGEERLITLGSFGDVDVRARLYDADGALVVADDDRPRDWNFRLAERLPAGHYTLRVDAVDSSGRTEISMDAPAERVEEPLRLDRSREITPGGSVVILPLDLPDTGVVAAQAVSSETIALGFEARVDGRWRAAGQQTGDAVEIAARLDPSADAWRLRAWSLDERGNPMTVRAAVLRPSGLGEASLRRGASLGRSRRDLPAAALVRLDRPGLIDLDTDAPRWCPAPVAACVPVGNLPLPVSAEDLWLIGGLGDARATVRGERLVLTTRPARVRLPAGAPVAADLSPGNGPVVVIARSPIGQPGIRLVDADAARDPVPGLHGFGVGGSAAVGVALSPRPVALLWNGSPDGAAIEATVRQRGFSAPTPIPFAAGSHEIPAGGGVALDLPADTQLQISLSAGLVAALSDDSGIRGVLWADGRAVDARLDVGTRLTVLDPEGSGGFFRVEAIPVGGSPEPLAHGAPLELQHLSAGRTQRFALPTAEGSVLRVRGAVAEAVLLGTDGVVHRGHDLPIGRYGGLLQIDHTPGFSMAWIDHPGDPTSLWGGAAEAPIVSTALPASVPLSGSHMRLSVDPTSAGLLRLRSGTGLAVGVTRPGGDPEVSIHQAGGLLDAILPAGETAIALRGLAGSPLWGRAELTWSPAREIGEGLGPSVLLSPGDTQLFSFHIDREGDVGFGVRAAADVVTCTLYDAAGVVRASGLVQMTRLEPGDYLLALHLPPDGTPVQARPALAGVEPPDTGPPLAVIRKYVQGADAGAQP